MGYAVGKHAVNVPPISVLDGTFLWISLGLFIAPVLASLKIRSLKIGELIELEREIEKTSETVREVKDEMRQAISVLSANLSATASVRTTVNVSSVQGQINPEPIAKAAPKLAPTIPPLSAMELKILNTAWLEQIHKFPDLMPRFTYRIDDGGGFAAAAESLSFKGLVGKTTDGQVFLTDWGLAYCKDNFKTFPTDTFFTRPEVSQEQMSRASEKVAGLHPTSTT